MTYTDIISTLEFNHMLIQRGKGQYEIVLNQLQQPIEQQKERLYAKAEKLTWVPYMVINKEGDAGILNIPRQIENEEEKPRHQLTPSSSISIDAIIPSSSISFMETSGSSSSSNSNSSGSHGGGKTVKKHRSAKRLTRSGRRKAEVG